MDPSHKVNTRALLLSYLGRCCQCYTFLLDKMILFFFYLFLFIQCDNLTSDDGNLDESEPEKISKTVLHASLITLESIGNDCALKTTNNKYPLRFVLYNLKT